MSYGFLHPGEGSILLVSKPTYTAIKELLMNCGDDFKREVPRVKNEGDAEQYNKKMERPTSRLAAEVEGAQEKLKMLEDKFYALLERSRILEAEKNQLLHVIELLTRPK